jgi:cell division protein FtsB
MPILENAELDHDHAYEAERPEDLRQRRRTYSWSAYGVERNNREKTVVYQSPLKLLWSEVLRRQSLMILAYCAVLVMFGFLTLTRMAAVAGMTQDIDKNKKILSELNKNNEILESEVAELDNPTRLWELAVNEINMVDPAFVLEIDN